MKKETPQQMLMSLNAKAAVWVKDFALAQILITLNKTENTEIVRINNYFTEQGRQNYNKATFYLSYLKIQIELFDELSELFLNSVKVVEACLANYESSYPAFFTCYLKNTLNFYETHITQVEIQKKFNTLEQFIRLLPPHLLIEDLSALVKAIKDKGHFNTINLIMAEFNKAISEIEEKKHPKAKKAALELEIKLATYTKAYFQDQDKETFFKQCNEAIEEAKPKLNDLSWLRKLQNLLLSLRNALAPQSNQSKFFKTKLMEKTEKLHADLRLHQFSCV